MIFGGDQPVFPNRDTAVAIRIDMAIRVSRNPAADLENSWFVTGIMPCQFDFDVEFGDRPVRGGNDTFLK